MLVCIPICIICYQFTGLGYAILRVASQPIKEYCQVQVRAVCMAPYVNTHGQAPIHINRPGEEWIASIPISQLVIEICVVGQIIIVLINIQAGLERVIGLARALVVAYKTFLKYVTRRGYHIDANDICVNVGIEDVIVVRAIHQYSGVSIGYVT